MDALGSGGSLSRTTWEEEPGHQGGGMTVSGVPTLVAVTPALQLPEKVARPVGVETPILQSLGAQGAGQSVEALIWVALLGVRRL